MKSDKFSDHLTGGSFLKLKDFVVSQLDETINTTLLVKECLLSNTSIEECALRTKEDAQSLRDWLSFMKLSYKQKNTIGS